MRFLTRSGVVALGVLLAACTSGSTKTGGSDGPGASKPVSPVATSSSAAPAVLRILLTNDDGYPAEGIDTVVRTLRGVTGVSVTVVAPATNQSGAGGTTTKGTIAAVKAKTKSGYPAVAVQGHPADTITWAIDQKGIGFRPDLVVSGINAGQNLGPIVDASGTVGAARAAVARGIPALAISAGFGTPIDYAAAAKQLLVWFTAHRPAIAAGTLSAATVSNLNVPTCTTGTVRGQLTVPLATSASGFGQAPNCLSTVASPRDDIQAFNDGFASLSQLSPRPAKSSP